MPVELYYELGSPPCAAVYMTAKALELDIDLKEMDLLAGDQLKPEFLAINPQHCVPTIVDDELTIWESRPIMIYLFEKYAKGDKKYLYPEDPEKRALINQRMFFDVGTFYQKIIDYYFLPVFIKAEQKETDFHRLVEIVSFINFFLAGEKFVAGNTLTLADISLYATTMCLKSCGFDISKYSNVEQWFNHVDSIIPGAEENRKAGEIFKQFLANGNNDITE